MLDEDEIKRKWLIKVCASRPGDAWVRLHWKTQWSRAGLAPPGHIDVMGELPPVDRHTDAQWLDWKLTEQKPWCPGRCFSQSRIVLNQVPLVYMVVYMVPEKFSACYDFHTRLSLCRQQRKFWIKISDFSAPLIFGVQLVFVGGAVLCVVRCRAVLLASTH